MKYIITEERETRLQILRRFNSTDWSWITEIVDEGVGMYNPCNFQSEAEWLNEISKSSAETYLLNYINDWKSKLFSTLSKYIILLIKKRMGEDIIDYYNDMKPECE